MKILKNIANLLSLTLLHLFSITKAKQYDFTIRCPETIELLIKNLNKIPLFEEREGFIGIKLADNVDLMLNGLICIDELLTIMKEEEILLIEADVEEITILTFIFDLLLSESVNNETNFYAPLPHFIQEGCNKLQEIRNTAINMTIDLDIKAKLCLTYEKKFVIKRNNESDGQISGSQYKDEFLEKN